MEASGIRISEAPIETSGAISVMESYHSPLSATYEKIGKEMSRDHTDSECLKMPLFDINTTIRPAELCPMLLMFGVIPRWARNTPSVMTLEMEEMIDKEMDEVTKLNARMRLALGLKHTGSPKGVEKSERL